jgi:hypothetical protein
VSADPGCGKSVLSKAIIDHDSEIEGLTICYFFFKDDNDKQKDITTALSALSHQLFSQKPRLVEHAMSDYGKNGKQLAQSFQLLWKIFTTAASDPLSGKIICVLDALDECTDSGRNQIIDTLSTFYKGPKPSSELKFLVTSRPYLDMERRFADLVQSFPTTIRLRGEWESNSISFEIDIVIKSEVARLSCDLGLTDSERTTLENELLNMEHRTYLWLKLIIEVIRDEINPTKTNLRRIIGELPATVDEAYESILSKIRKRDKKKAQKLLHIIVSASRPLTLKEICIALSIEDCHRSFDDLDLDLEDQTRLESLLRNHCGFFICVVNQKVYLIHQTAKEFLLAKNGSPTEGRWKHSIDPVESDLVISSVCVTYLMLNDFDRPVDNTSTTGKFELFDYAAKFWATHFQKAQHHASEELVQLVTRVCNAQSHRFEAWFETYWYTNHPTWPIPLFDDAIMVASFFGHDVAVGLLLAAGNPRFDGADREYRRTPLLWAAEKGYPAVVFQLLWTGAVDVNWADEHGQTPLGVAAENGHRAVVELLLEMDEVKVDWEDKFNQTPYTWAICNGHRAVAELLVDAQPEIHIFSKAGVIWPTGIGI